MTGRGRQRQAGREGKGNYFTVKGKERERRTELGGLHRKNRERGEREERERERERGRERERERRERERREKQDPDARAKEIS